MARTVMLGDEAVQAAREMVQKAESARELRAGLSILVPKECRVSNAATARVLGVGVATVVRMQRKIRDQVDGKSQEKGHWGGRRREILSVEEEEAFLRPWVEKAETGGVLVVPPIHAALEERLCFPVADSTVYRMLARHGWRKVAPDTCHPKRDEQAQEAFKKNSRRRWQKLPEKTP